MKVLPLDNRQKTNNFKSTYPVVHRIIASNGTYIPVSDFEKIKKMQRKLVKTLNTPWEKILQSLDNEAKKNVLKWVESSSLNSVKSELKLPKTEQEALAIFRGRMGYYDLDYCFATDPQKRVRSFYNKEKGLIDGRYYISYIISGKNIQSFEDDLAKNIGKTKHEAINIINSPYSPESKVAIDCYNKNGLEYVNDKQYRLKSKNTGMTYILLANFEPIFNKIGKITDFKFISAKFVPEYTK